MVSIQLSVVHRLPQSYCWLPGFIGIKVEPIHLSGKNEDNCLIGLKLLSHEGTDAWRVMQQLNASLKEIQIDCAMVECEGEPCLFVQRSDESAVMCLLKHVGAAIAERLIAHYPF